MIPSEESPLAWESGMLFLFCGFLPRVDTRLRSKARVPSAGLLAACGALVIATGSALAASPATTGAPPPSAEEPPPQPEARDLVNAAFVERVRDHLNAEIVTLTVRNQNRAYRDLSRVEVKDLDSQWRAERNKPDKPLIAATLATPLSNYLTRIQAQSIGLFTEIFVTDRLGLNVGQSAITSDYWQGDEAKFKRTFPRGPGTIFLDDAEWHAESATWRVQLNLTVADADSREAIGAATFEINLTELARRRATQ